MHTPIVRRLLVAVLCGLIVWMGRPEAACAQSNAASVSDSVEVGASGFRLVDGNGAFELRLRGDLYADARFFPGTDVVGGESFFIRRTRLRLQGALYDRFAFTLRPDFGSGGPELDDAYLEVRVTPTVYVRGGRFKVPVGLENLQSTTGLMHVERGFPTGLVPGRDVGFMVNGDVAQGRLSYALGVFNGGPTGGEGDLDNAKEGAARLFATPFVDTASPLEGLGVGIAGTLGEIGGAPGASGLPGFKTTGRQPFFEYRQATVANGTRWRLAPQARFFRGPVELLAEYTVLTQDVRQRNQVATLTHSAWQVSGAVVLTGEAAREGEVEPDQPFGVEPGPGAFELGLRIHGLSLDSATFPLFAAPASAADGARAVGGTLSWYPNAAVRFMLGYERTTFGAAGGAPERPAENLLLARMQLAF